MRRAQNQGYSGSNGDFPPDKVAARAVLALQTPAFPPGIGVDAQARAGTPKLAEILGVRVVIENKPGGGTLLARPSRPMPASTWRTFLTRPVLTGPAT